VKESGGRRRPLLLSSIGAVLKPQGGDGATCSPAQRELFIWYQYLCLGRGKPMTHMHALNATQWNRYSRRTGGVSSRISPDDRTPAGGSFI
jgi:hypothetical protein